MGHGEDLRFYLRGHGEAAGRFEPAGTWSDLHCKGGLGVVPRMLHAAHAPADRGSCMWQ